MSNKNTFSFTSADIIPLKLFYHPEVKAFAPIHIQWLPTNACNLNCPSCSCAKRDKSLSMPFSLVEKVIKEFAQRGCKAVTITGGGEPLMYAHINETIELFHKYHIKIGLTTNGLLLGRLDPSVLDLVTWCRISSMDYRNFDFDYQEMLAGILRPKVDWAFSHVVGANPNLTAIKNLVLFANNHGFTHVRIVSDLLRVNNTKSSFSDVRETLQGIDEQVIYQARNKPVPCSSCLIGYIKPLIAPDFKMYLCCGVQYALAKKSLDLPDELCMGTALNLEKTYQNFEPKITKCVSCYYTNYNNILAALQQDLIHKEFI